jgi:nitrous oxidase accessory protein NosD
MKKILTFGIMLLFVGSSVVSSGCNNVERSYRTSIYSPHDPIYINGNDEFISENGVTGGSGTINNPYLIEDWKINASSQDGITIRNVSVYFTISNCYVHDGGINNDGIVFINVTHGEIEESIIIGNRDGIRFMWQEPNFEGSSNNSVHHNKIINNKKNGTCFEHTMSYHIHNVIYLNNISNNHLGIYMIMSAYNQIFFNNIISNTIGGINLSICMGGGTNNSVYNNNFIDNGDGRGQAFTVGTINNNWDDGYPSGGNYWSDYNGLDNFSGPNQNIPGSDGIGDKPYNITTISHWDDDYDYYPLMKPWNRSNNPPYGPSLGLPGVSYTFCFDLPDNPDCEPYDIYWDWGDGSYSDWMGPFVSGETACENHSWDERGVYFIKVKIRDNCGNSYWSLPFIISIGIPIFEIKNIRGGLLKIGVTIKNIAEVNATNVHWRITLVGGIILTERVSEGVIESIPSGEEGKINSGIIIGFGAVTIIVEVWIGEEPPEVSEFSGFVYLFFMKISPGG